MRRRRSRVLRQSMIDERLGCRLSGFMLVIDWQGCRVGVDPFFIIILGGSGFPGLAVVQ